MVNITSGHGCSILEDLNLKLFKDYNAHNYIHGACMFICHRAVSIGGRSSNRYLSEPLQKQKVLNTSTQNTLNFLPSFSWTSVVPDILLHYSHRSVTGFHPGLEGSSLKCQELNLTNPFYYRIYVWVRKLDSNSFTKTKN